ARRQFTDVLLERVRAVPGVEAAAVTNVLPFAGSMNASVVTPEGYVPEPEEALAAPINSRVSDGYFATLGIDVLAGREFTAADAAAAPLVAMVDRTLAERFWPGRDPIGQRITQGAPAVGSELTYRAIVGVVDDVRVMGIADEQPPGHYYIPVAQAPSAVLFVAVRTRAEPLALGNTLRTLVSQLDPDLPAHQVLAMEQRIAS